MFPYCQLWQIYVHVQGQKFPWIPDDYVSYNPYLRVTIFSYVLSVSNSIWQILSPKNIILFFLSIWTLLTFIFTNDSW